MLNKTKIVCSIGTQSENESVIEEMMKEGMNVARLNMANGDFHKQNEFINIIRKLSLIHDRSIAIMLDTYGPKIRTSEFESSSIQLAKGCKVTIHTQEEILGNNEEFSIICPDLFSAINLEDKILINEGAVPLLVISKDALKKTIICEVLKSGIIKDNSLVNIPNVHINVPCIGNDDATLLKFASDAKIDFIAASFIKNENDILEIRNTLKENGSNASIFAKIENSEAVNNFSKILEVSDGIIISRGDLSIEVEYELLPIIIKKMIKEANMANKPVVVSTQILSSMTRNKRPSRAEVSDVANLILDGVDAICLSNVTTLGLYPIKGVKELSKIINVTEEHQFEIRPPFKGRPIMFEANKEIDYDLAVSEAVIATSRRVNAKLIVAFSESGATSKRISANRPNCPIASVSSNETIRNSLALNWGIYPVVATHKTYEIDFITLASELATYYGLKEGDTFIITGGNGIGNTNLMKVCKL